MWWSYDCGALYASKTKSSLNWTYLFLGLSRKFNFDSNLTKIGTLRKELRTFVKISR